MAADLAVTEESAAVFMPVDLPAASLMVEGELAVRPFYGGSLRHGYGGHGGYHGSYGGYYGAPWLLTGFGVRPGYCGTCAGYGYSGYGLDIFARWRSVYH
jgi:hypothetical protein